MGREWAGFGRPDPLRFSVGRVANLALSVITTMFLGDGTEVIKKSVCHLALKSDFVLGSAQSMRLVSNYIAEFSLHVLKALVLR